MDKQHMEKVIEQIARDNKVSEEEVRREIEFALSVTALKELAPEEAIAYLAKIAADKM